MLFQLLFYTVMGNYFFLGSMDHLLSKPGIVSATNKDSINISRCRALWDAAKFNSGSWLIGLYMVCLAYATVLEQEDWCYDCFPEDYLYAFLFAGPPALIAALSVIVPIILNPFILGWPFNPPLCGGQKKKVPDRTLPKTQSQRRNHSSSNGRTVVGLDTFMNVDAARELNKEMGRVHKKPDVELGSLATHEFGGRYPLSATGHNARINETHAALAANNRAAAQKPVRRQQRQEQRPPQTQGRKGSHEKSGPLAMI